MEGSFGRGWGELPAGRPWKARGSTFEEQCECQRTQSHARGRQGLDLGLDPEDMGWSCKGFKHRRDRVKCVFF